MARMNDNLRRRLAATGAGVVGYSTAKPPKDAAVPDEFYSRLPRIEPVEENEESGDGDAGVDNEDDDDDDGSGDHIKQAEPKVKRRRVVVEDQDDDEYDVNLQINRSLLDDF